MPRPRQLPDAEKSALYLTADTKSEQFSSFERASVGVLGDDKPFPLERQSKSPLRDNPPDGGLFAWLQVLAGFFLVLNSRGLTNTFGVFQTYYTDVQLKGTNPSAISWIGSIQTFLLMFGGVFCGRLLDAGHLRVQLCAGITLQFMGMTLTSFATKYWQILLAQGFCVGIGSSFLWLPSVVVIAQYFDTKIMIATGIAATGSSAAGVIYPILVQKLMMHVGYAWAVRVMAFVVLALNSTSLIIMRLRIPPRTGGKFFDLSMFRDPAYTTFVGAMVFLYASVYIPYFYIQDYARYRGVSAGGQIYILSILNGASLVSRVIPSWIADKAGSLNVLIPCTLISCASIFVLLGANNTATIFTIVIIYGLFSGALVSLPPATIASISKNPDEYGTRIGMAFAVCAFGVLVGNPIGGALLASGFKSNDTQPYMRLWFFAGGVMFIAGALIAVTRYLVRCCTEDDEDDDSASTRTTQTEKYQTSEQPDQQAHHHHHVVPTRRGKRWHQILVEDALAMQGLSVF